jgi:hypothetical protein
MDLVDGRRVAPAPQSHRRAPQHLNIAVTHLAEDEGRKQEKLLLEELGNFEGVNLLLVKRTVDPGPEQPNKTVAEEKARGLLKQSGADVLI